MRLNNHSTIRHPLPSDLNSTKAAAAVVVVDTTEAEVTTRAITVEADTLSSTTNISNMTKVVAIVEWHRPFHSKVIKVGDIRDKVVGEERLTLPLSRVTKAGVHQEVTDRARVDVDVDKEQRAA
jgi:hypothetical protein